MDNDSGQGLFLFLCRRLQLSVVHKLLQTVQDKPAVRVKGKLQAVLLHRAQMLRGFLQHSLYERPAQRLQFLPVPLLDAVAEREQSFFGFRPLDPNALAG